MGSLACQNTGPRPIVVIIRHYDVGMHSTLRINTAANDFVSGENECLTKEKPHRGRIGDSDRHGPCRYGDVSITASCFFFFFGHKDTDEKPPPVWYF